MANAFRSDLNWLAQDYLSKRVASLNGNNGPFWNGFYPGGMNGKYLTGFTNWPPMAYPANNGASAIVGPASAATLRADVIALAMYYQNIVRASWAGGLSYVAMGDELPTNSYRPDSNPYVVVGTDGTGYGMSNGGGTDDGLSGTNNTYGGYSQNSWSGSILQDYAITHRGVGGNRWFCLRYKPGGYAGKYCMVYDQNFNVFGYGQLVFRQQMGYALPDLQYGFDSFLGQRVYIYIADGPPPRPTDNVIMADHKNRFAAAINSIDTVSGDLTQYSVARLYDQAWNVIYSFIDDVTANLNV